ncbi:hypothetical protein [Bradyrhizobium glycinis]|uniref:hypothetical protein n=1 Tax=Bradyrhizobium glycinis TaxID=2751812 RepID=UPI0018D7FEEF|nr:hypothetical protein [Bradyrhizobium glycinis]MBH5371074.1 hypothetical protein [Bradyrhizobium glycinis]
MIWDFREVVRVVEGLVATMDARQDQMRDQGLQNWPGGRTFVIIDAYAEIQSEIDTADGKEEKAIAKRLSGNLVRIARRARALGIVLICALQKPTLDAMDSALRSNLGCRTCLRVGSNQLGRVAGGTPLHCHPADHRPNPRLSSLWVSRSDTSP